MWKVLGLVLLTKSLENIRQDCLNFLAQNQARIFLAGMKIHFFLYEKLKFRSLIFYPEHNQQETLITPTQSKLESRGINKIHH